MSPETLPDTHQGTGSQPSFTSLCRPAAIIRLLGHPQRLKILALLNDHERPVKDVGEALEMQQAVTSQHLTLLRNLGVIDGQRRGTEIHYRIADPLAQRIISIITGR